MKYYLSISTNVERQTKLHMCVLPGLYENTEDIREGYGQLSEGKGQ